MMTPDEFSKKPEPQEQVHVLLFHPPPEFGGETEVVGVFADKQTAAFTANDKIQFAISKIKAQLASCPAHKLQYYRDDYTEAEMRAWCTIKTKVVSR